MRFTPIKSTDILILVPVVTLVTCVRWVEADSTTLGVLDNAHLVIDRKKVEVRTVEKTMPDIGCFIAACTGFEC